MADSRLKDITRQAFKDKMGYSLLDPLKFVFVCTHAKDPNKDKSLRSHWGENIRILRGFVGSHAFANILRGLKKQDLDALPVITRCACLCKKGRHRSVAAAWCLRKLFSYLGFKVLPTVHVCEADWDICTDCLECINAGAAAEWVKIGKQIRDYWNSL